MNYFEGRKNLLLRKSCSSDDYIIKFKELIPSSVASFPCSFTEISLLNPMGEQVDCLVGDTMLDPVAQRKAAPRYNSQISSMKH